MFSRSDVPTEVPASTAEQRGSSCERPGAALSFAVDEIAAVRELAGHRLVRQLTSELDGRVRGIRHARHVSADR